MMCTHGWREYGMDMAISKRRGGRIMRTIHGLRGLNVGMVVVFLLIFSVFPMFIIAQEQYPTRPINVVSVGNAGGGGDLVTRVLLSKAEKILNQPFVITNNNLGGGSVPLAAFAKARPDGYNLVTTPSAPLTWIPHSQAVSYKNDDFIPVMCHGLITSGIVVKADSPWKTFKDVVEYARKNPGKFIYAISGAGNPMDIAMQYVAKIEGVQWSAMPVPTTDPNMLVLGGHVNALSASMSWKQHVLSGTMRLLAVHSTKRLSDFPDVQTFRELGYDFVNETLPMVLVPKGTPEAIVTKLDDVLKRAMEEKEYRDILKKFDWEFKYLGHEDLKKYIDQTYLQVGNVIKQIRN